MRRFLENKFTVAAILLLFAVAFAWNTAEGAGWAIPGHFQIGIHPATEGHGLSLPPDPWDQVRVAHGPGMPPDPWDQVRIAHGPGMPPDPWDQVRVAHGPGMPPDPWDQVRVA
jgi:hypothetical protein